MKNWLLLLFLLQTSAFNTYAQKDIKTFIFGHSLINHEFQVNETPSQETSVPHWFHFLAQEAGHSYAVSGQYGFLPQHANLPPIAQWGFDVVPGAWESDLEPFNAADFNTILLTPANFVQWQGPDQNYPNESVSPFSATRAIFDWCLQQEDSLTLYIYENWPDMAPYLSSGFPPNASDWDTYLAYLNGDFHNWFLDYHDLLIEAFPDACVRMIPVGPLINNLMTEAPFDQIPITELYEDDAPHGRASIYFLASLATYMAMYEEKAPANFAVDPIIHPIIRTNYSQAVDYIWEGLLEFQNEAGENRVFCAPLTTSTIKTDVSIPNLSIYPNPTNDQIYIEDMQQDWQVSFHNLQGQLVRHTKSNTSVNISHLSNGTYLMVVRDLEFNIIGKTRVVKQ